MVGQLSKTVPARGRKRPVLSPPTGVPQPALKEAALDRLVPGDYPRTEADLAAFPASTLDLLARSGVKVAILDQGETLADSPGLPGPDRSQYQLFQNRANELFRQQAADLGPVETLNQLQESGEKLTRLMRQNNLDFSVGLALQNFRPEELAQREQIPQEHREEWTQALLRLNAGMLAEQPEGLQATTGMLILPFTYHQGRPVAEVRLQSAQQTSAEFVEGSLGLHRAEDRLVLLHEKFLGLPAQEVGNYRLAIHEMGHALDHVLDRLVGFPGFGSLHRQTVDALYQADQERARSSSVKEVFTSERASEDVREYFAEAVEAYLTQPCDDGGDTFRADNSNPGLRSRNPEFYSYMETIFKTDFASAEPPERPVRSLLPEGFPDPETEVRRVV